MSALAYPLIIGIFAFVLTVGLMRGVMPQIIPLLRSLHVDLPLITKVVMYISENIGVFCLYVSVGAIFIIPLSILCYKKIFRFRLFCHKFLVSIPLIGSLLRQYNFSIFMRSLGGLISSGAGIEYSYTSVSNKIFLLPLNIYFNGQKKYISQGISLVTIFNGLKHLPTYIVPLIQAGLASGTLGDSLMRASDILDRDMENNLKRLTAIIEPVMMISIGLVIGCIALSIMMPIYDVSRALQH